MRLQKIKICGFKSIYDELTINFDNINGFWKIAGDTGSGKTTIGEAIIFGLFGTVSGKPNDSLISWGEKHSVIETWLQSKNHNIYIKREINKYGQSPLYVMIDGEELIFTNKRDGQSQLETEYYDVSRTTLELLCIISFNNFKSLATLNTADTKKFLDQVLGFSTLSEYSDACRELRKLPHQECLNILKQIDSNNDQIKKIDELSNMARIEGDIEVVNKECTELVTERKIINDKYESELADHRKTYNELTSQLARIKTLGANKRSEIDFIKKGTCPTCGAPIDQSQLETKLAERQVLIEQYNIVNEKINQINKLITKTTEQQRSRDNVIKNELLEKRNLLMQLKEQEKRSNINKGEIVKLQEENKELQKQVDALNVDDEQWLELQNILSDDIRYKILSNFIPSLNNNIMLFTQQLHIPYVITFDSSFKCNISICGMNELIPLSSLSTGQLKIVDMCIILGVLGAIMSNVSFNILFLDELVSNMSFEVRSLVCQVLKQNISKDQTLFIISHTELESKYFDGEVDVKMEYMDEARRKSVYKIKKEEIL